MFISSVAGRGSVVESLESRTLCSAEQYNMLSLLHYNRLGSSWTYATTYTQVNDGKSTKGSGNATVSVGKKTGKVNGIASDLLTLIVGKLKLSTFWYTNSTGTFIDLVSEPTTLATINVQLNNTKVGPANMVVGKKYTSKGTIGGSFSGTYKGKAYVATITGTDALSAQLIGHQTIKTKLGTFNTIQGTDTATINGRLSIKVAGTVIGGLLTASHSQSFNAAPSVGIVKFTDVDNATVTVPAVVTTTTKLTVAGSIISDILK